MPGPEIHQGKTKPGPFESLRGIIPRFRRFMNAPAKPEYRKMLTIDASSAAFAGALMLPITKSGMDKLSKIDDQNHLIYEIQHYDLYPDSVINSIESMDIVPESVKVFRSNPFDNSPENNKFNISFTSKNADLFIPPHKNRQSAPHARITLKDVPLTLEQASDFHRFLGGKWEASDYYRLAIDVTTALAGIGVAVKGYQLGGSKGTIISGLGSLSAIGALSDLTKSKISFFQNLKGPSQDIVAQMAIVPAYNQAGIEVEIGFLKSCIGIGDQPTPPFVPSPIHEPVPGPTFEITPTPEKPIEITAEEWASSKETRIVIPEKIFPTVGCIALPVDDLNPDGEKLPYMHHRAIDLKFQSLNLTFVTDVNLHEEGFSDHQGIRQFIANDMNKQKKLLDQLKTIEDELKDKGEVYVVIDGKNPGKGLSTPEPGSSYPEAYVSNIAVKNSNGFYSWYKLEEDENGGFTRPATKEEEPQLLPQLAINGKDIIRTDSLEATLLRGFVVWNPIEGTDSPASLSDTIKLFKIAKSQGGNMVRLMYLTDSIKPKIETIKQMVKVAEQMGMYIMFTPAQTVKNQYANLEYPDQEVADTVAYLAKELKNNSNVILDVYNEPHFDDYSETEPQSHWDVYIPSVKLVIDSVKKENPDVIITVSGLKYGAEFRNKELMSLNTLYDNVLYRVTDDPVPWGNPPGSEMKDFRHQWKNSLLDGKHAVMLGEFNVGGANDEWKNTEFEQRWMEQSLAIASQYNLSWTAFMLDTRGANNHSLIQNISNSGIVQWKPRGEIAITGLQSHPPTQFDN